MNYVDKMATYLAESINRNHEGSSSVAVLKYALIAMINQFITMALVLVISSITGDFIPALIACFLFPILRYFSGGFHFKSPVLCNVVTAGFILVAVYLPVSYWYNGFILNIVTIFILALNAPSGIKRSTLDKKYYPRLKLIAILIVCVNFVIQSPVISIAFFIQSLTTFTIFEKLIDKVDI